MNNDSTSITFTQVYNDFKGAISGIAETLKVGSEHVYEILVRQQFINAIEYTTYLFFSIVFLSIFLKGLYNEEEIWEDDKGNATPNLYVKGGFLLLGVIMLMGTLLNIDVIITGFFNPEYGAIMEIKSFIK